MSGRFEESRRNGPYSTRRRRRSSHACAGMPEFPRLLVAPRQPVRLGFAGQALARLVNHELDGRLRQKLFAGARNRVHVDTTGLHPLQVNQLVKVALDALEGGKDAI